jgi:hypothetical protein
MLDLVPLLKTMLIIIFILVFVCAEALEGLASAPARIKEIAFSRKVFPPFYHHT